MNSTISDEDIRDYLQNHIKRSIINDVGTSLDCYPQHSTKETGMIGFFAIPRLLFPEIDGLGSYITGCAESTTLNITTFVNDIMSLVDNRYKGNGGFIAKIYRHGLMHQHTPKSGLYNGKVLAWSLSYGSNDDNHPDPFHLSWQGENLNLNLRKFYKDTLKAIELFIPLVQQKYKGTFLKAYKEQNKLKILTSSDCTYIKAA